MFEHQISILEQILKERVTLKTDVVAAENSDLPIQINYNTKVILNCNNNSQ